MKLGYMMLLVAVGAMLVFAPVAMAAKGGDKGGKGHDMGLFGKVTKVEDGSFTMEVKGKKDAPKDAPAEVKTIKTTASTEVVKGEEKGAKITVGDRVAVTLDKDGAAAKITIMPAHEKKAK
jgi:hypothetical protein